MPETKSKTIHSASSGRASQKSKVQVEVKKPVIKASKAVAKKAVKKTTVFQAKKKTASVNLTIEVFNIDGKSSGKITLAPEIFGEKVNKKLIAQAVRVYQANKRQGNASTKTRGEVDGSTRKIYRQKGTGNARHGSVRAPIFVKGGIVHGPRPRDFGLELPKKMKRKALFSILSGKLADGEIKVLSGFETIAPKTRQFVSFVEKLALADGKKKLLLIAPDNFENARRASRNIEGISSTSALRLNALDVISSKYLLFTKEAITEMEKYFLKNN